MDRPILISIAVLWAASFFLLVGCGAGGSQGGSQGGQEAHASRAQGAAQGEKLALPPEGDSGVSGTAAFENASKGVVVELELRGLPKPNTLYLAHIHPGPCDQEEEEEGDTHGHGEHGEHAEESGGRERMEDGHEHGEEIEYPLSEVKSGSKGQGSSTTTLHDTSVDKLFSGGPKHVNVHEAGVGDPPVLTCAQLKQAE